MRYFVYYWGKEDDSGDGSETFTDYQEAVKFAERLRNEADLVCEIYLGKLVEGL